MSWTAFSKTYRKNGCVLALGAGASKGCGLPDWIELLKRIATAPACFGADGAGLVDELLESSFSLPAIAGILRSRCGDRRQFAEIVREALYREFPYKSGVGKGNHTAYFRYVCEANKTLAAVGSFCAHKASARRFEANPRVHAVVNLNLDALLQSYVTARFRKRLVRTIERPSARTFYGRINVYHLHGYLAFGAKAGDPAKEAADRLILTEQEYFDFFNRPNSIFNYTFLYLLREHHCLFVGLSMHDENIRRLLYYSVQERQSGTAVARRVAGKRAMRHFAVLKRGEASARVEGASESALNHLGVSVLWVDDFAEIPDRLGEAYAAAGADWAAVY